jgi:hypothetical protein
MSTVPWWPTGEDCWTPCSGAGFVQPLDLFITPPPHDKLHFDQAVQSDKPPSTDKQGKTYYMKLYKLIKIEYSDNLIFLMIFGEVYSGFLRQ